MDVSSDDENTHAMIFDVHIIGSANAEYDANVKVGNKNDDDDDVDGDESEESDDNDDQPDDDCRTESI